jgi:hypothetical protein
MQQVLTQIELEAYRTRRNIEHPEGSIDNFRAGAVAAQCKNFQCHMAGLWKLLWRLIQGIIVYRPQAVNWQLDLTTESGLVIFILSLSGAFRCFYRRTWIAPGI